jgi:hypothetical protein
MSSLLWASMDNSVVVNYIKPAGITPESLGIAPLSLTMMIQEELSKTKRFNVINFADVFNTEKLGEISRNAEYSEYDAILLGLETKTDLVVLGRTRLLSNKIWIQLGLFDAEVQGKIREASGYYDNTLEDIAGRAVPELVRRLIDSGAWPKPEEKVLEKTVIVDRTKYLKWTVLGILTASAVYLIETLATQKGGDTPVNPNTEINARW